MNGESTDVGNKTILLVGIIVPIGFISIIAVAIIIAFLVRRRKSNEVTTSDAEKDLELARKEYKTGYHSFPAKDSVRISE